MVLFLELLKTNLVYNFFSSYVYTPKPYVSYNIIWSNLTWTSPCKPLAQIESLNIFFFCVRVKFHICILVYISAVGLRREKCVWGFLPWKKMEQRVYLKFVFLVEL